MSNEDVLVVQETLSKLIPRDGFGYFVRDMVFGTNSKNSIGPAVVVDWGKMARLIAYHFPETLRPDHPFHAVYMRM